MLPIKHVAERWGLDWDTVKAIDKAWMLRTLPPRDRTGVTRLAYGFRDDDYFALKIHSAFPGNAR